MVYKLVWKYLGVLKGLSVAFFGIRNCGALDRVYFQIIVRIRLASGARADHGPKQLYEPKYGWSCASFAVNRS